MILWLLTVILQQLVTNSMCTHNVNKSFLNGNRRTVDILLFVSDEVLYHTGRPSNISSHQNMLINLSDNLYKNFVRCSQASLFDEPKCAFDSPGRDQRRILTFRLDKNIALNGVKSILDKVNIHYAIKPQFNLYSLILISNSKVIKMFEIIFKFSNYLVLCVDVNNSFNFVQKKYGNELKRAEINEISKKSIVDNLSQQAQFLNINPSVKSALDIINYFKTVNKLDNVNFYLSDSKQISDLYQRKEFFRKNNFKIENVNSLKHNFLLLAKKNPVNLKQKGKKLNKMETFFLSDNLNVLKCDATTLYEILRLYQSIQSIYPAGKINSIRNLIWIPEDIRVLDENLSIKLNRLCTSFQIYILNLKLDLDLIIDKMDHQLSAKDLSETGTLSLKIYQPSRSCAPISHPKLVKPEFNFMVNMDRIYLTDSQLVLGEQEWDMANKNTKRSYRIVSNHVEPFIIISKLDEHLSSKDQCKDGLPCLDIDINSSFYKSSNILDEQIAKILKKDQMIEMIKNFKFMPDEELNLNSTVVKTRCCTGYMINLLQELSTDLNFEFELYFVNDMNDKQKNVKWNEALDHAINQVAHIIAGPFSITQDRAEKIDFSVPFLYTGYSILIKQEKKGVDDLWMFMRPFTYLHWVVILLVGLFSAISLALLEFNSPFGLNPNGRQRARNYTLGSAVSVFISLMFMHTMPAKSPKSWAGKWTQNFIGAFALIFIATYTAKMASILSAGQETRSYKGIDDNELLNLKRGYLRSSSIVNHMCRNSKDTYKSHCNYSITLPNDDAGIDSVLNGSLDVYLSDYLILDYLRFKQTNCNLKLIGQDFATTGYALGMSKWMKEKEKNEINIQLLKYYERGFLDELYHKWFNKRVKCNRKAADDKIRIDFEQYKGVFGLLGIGIVAAVVVLFLEQALYKWTIPFLRKKSKNSSWKSLKLMFISQRFYRIVHSEEYYEATHSAKEFINVFKKRDFEAIFQKSFRKKQLESLHGSQLRKRPKLWALIEASTERHSRDLMNQISPDLSEEEKSEKRLTEEIDLTNLPKDKILILKYNDTTNDTDKKRISIVNLNPEEKEDSLSELDFIFTKLSKGKNKLTREKSIIYMDENFSDSDNTDNEKKHSDIARASTFSHNGSIEHISDSPNESSTKFIDKFEIDSQISKYIDSINE